MFTPDRFKGKVIIITGATSGIGKCAAIRAGLEGGKVVCVGRNVQRGEDVVKTIKEKGGEAIFVQADVSKPEGVNKVFDETMKTYGRLDCLVNNAGVLQELVDVMTLEFSEFKRIMDINVDSVFLCTQKAGEIFKKQGTGGSIVNVSSVTGLVGFKNAAAYVASKHAVSGLTKATAYDLAQYKVRVNATCPHNTTTPMTDASGANFAKIAQESGKSFQEILYDKVGQKMTNLQGRSATPEEQASTILYLASDESSHITGSVIATDNGFTCF